MSSLFLQDRGINSPFCDFTACEDAFICATTVCRMGAPVSRSELQEAAMQVVHSQADLRRTLPPRLRGEVRMTKHAKSVVYKSEKASDDWFTGFMSRHPQISSLRAGVLDSKRAQASTQETCDKHFRRLEETLKKFKLLDDNGYLTPGATRRIGNVDECPGNQKGSRKKKVVGSKGKPCTFHVCILVNHPSPFSQLVTTVLFHSIPHTVVSH